MPYQLRVVQGRSASPAVKLGAGVTTVGRQADCQLRIQSSLVSRKHCELFEKKGLLIVKDLGSSNGTLVNGQKVEDQRVLEPGDELSIGQVRLKVEKVADAAPAAVGAAPGRKPSDTAVAEAVAVDDADMIDEDAVFEIDLDDAEQTRQSMPAAPAATAPVPPPPPPPTAKPAAPAEDAPIEIGEDDVAGFLLDLDIDEDDKT